MIYLPRFLPFLHQKSVLGYEPSGAVLLFSGVFTQVWPCWRRWSPKLSLIVPPPWILSN